MSRTVLLQDAPVIAGPADRPRYLARTERVSTLGAAIDRAGSSKSAVARACGVDERIVRDICAGLRPLTEERLRACPPSVERAFYETRLEELDEGAPASGMAPALHVVLAGERHGELCSVTRQALVDAVFTCEEKRTVRKRARAVIAVVQAFVRDLDREIAAEEGR